MTPPKLESFRRSLGDVVTRLPPPKRPRPFGATTIAIFTAIGLALFAFAVAWSVTHR